MKEVRKLFQVDYSKPILDLLREFGIEAVVFTELSTNQFFGTKDHLATLFTTEWEISTDTIIWVMGGCEKDTNPEPNEINEEDPVEVKQKMHPASILETLQFHSQNPVENINLVALGSIFQDNGEEKVAVINVCKYVTKIVLYPRSMIWPKDFVFLAIPDE